MQTKKNRITICTAVWKRPEVFETWLRCMNALDPIPFVVAVGSPDDQCQVLAEKYGVAYFQKPNKPVGFKWNYAHLVAQGTADYYLTTGSDDVMDQTMWDYYLNFNGERLTLKDLYFYDTVSKRSLFWKGYKNDRTVRPIGAHQLHRADVMEKMNWKPFNDASMGDEAYTQRQCDSLGIKTTCLRMSETGGIAIDIKSRDSYSPFRQWNNSEFIDTKVLIDKSPELMKIIL